MKRKAAAPGFKPKGKGYGKRQIEELLRIFKQEGCKRAKVSTSDNDFFIPARRMYERIESLELPADPIDFHARSRSHPLHQLPGVLLEVADAVDL
jgi:ribosomal protein S18 acetylase RimI-like enzyme